MSLLRLIFLIADRRSQRPKRLITESGNSWYMRYLFRQRRVNLVNIYQRTGNLMILFAFTTVLQIGEAFALCALTTENLLRIEIYACQPVAIGASVSTSDTHAIHKRGARMKGTLITGRVVASNSVWLADSDDGRYIVEAPIVPAGIVASFFVQGSVRDNCDDSVGTELVFVTDRPCCDVIPASGLCLIPESIAIVREEHMPERWSKWQDESTDY